MTDSRVAALGRALNGAMGYEPVVGNQPAHYAEHVAQRLAEQGYALVRVVPPTRLVRVSPDLAGNFGTRTERGRLLTAAWGDEDEGAWELVFNETDDGMVVVPAAQAAAEAARVTELRKVAAFLRSCVLSGEKLTPAEEAVVDAEFQNWPSPSRDADPDAVIDHLHTEYDKLQARYDDLYEAAHAILPEVMQAEIGSVIKPDAGIALPVTDALARIRAKGERWEALRAVLEEGNRGSH